MIKISKIEVQKNHKDRVNIFVDDEYYTSMFLDTAVKYGIKKDLEIDENELKRYLSESEQNLAFSKALKYMDSTLKTAKQIREYLKKKGYDKLIIDNVVAKLKEYNYINDKAFAEAYIGIYKSKYGKTMLRNKLIQKGVSKEVLEELLNDFESKEEIIDKLIKKKIGNKVLDNDLKVKCVRFLAGRGFGYDEINSAFRRINTTNEGENYESWD